MKIKFLKKLAGKLNRNEGISLTPIIAIMVIMSIMGGVFTSIMGNWKVSAPVTINSSKAYYLAETAAMFALQDAKNKFFSVNASLTPLYPSTTTGTRSAPYVVSSSSTESSEYWIERPYPSANTSVDEYPIGTHRGNNDDDTTGVDDDVVDDDGDDSSHDPDPKLYTIIATGKVLRGGNTVAKRQVKIKATITDNGGAPVEPGIHTTGEIHGSGPGFNIFNSNPTPTATVTYGNGPADTIVAGSETDLIYRSDPELEEDVFRAMAQGQGNYFPGDFPSNPPTDPYPNGSFYLDAPTNTIPNVVFIEGSFAINGSDTFNGIFYVKGSTTALNGNYQVNGILISAGDISMNGSPQDPDINGGIIHTGNTITANGNPNVSINEDFFDALNASIPVITIQSLQEAVSAN